MNALDVLIGQRMLPRANGERHTSATYAGFGNRHLMVIADGARRYGEGDLTQPTYDPGTDELGAVARALDWAGARSHLVHHLERRTASDARAQGLAQELGWSAECAAEDGAISREHVLRLTLWLDPVEDLDESAAELARVVDLPSRLRLCLGDTPRLELTAPSRGAREAERYCSELSSEPFELSLSPPSSRARISARQRGASSTTQPTQGAG